MAKEIERKGKRKLQEDVLDPFLEDPTDEDFFFPDGGDPYAIDVAPGNSGDGRQNSVVAKEVSPRSVAGPAPTSLPATQSQNAVLPWQLNMVDMSSLLPAFQAFLQMQSMFSGRRMVTPGMPPIPPTQPTHEDVNHHMTQRGRRKSKKQIADLEDDPDADMFEDSGSDKEEFSPIDSEITKARAARLRQFRRGQVKKAWELSRKRVQEGLKPYEIRIDEVGRARGVHRGLWTNMVRGYAKRLDPSIVDLKAQTSW